MILLPLHNAGPVLLLTFFAHVGEILKYVVMTPIHMASISLLPRDVSVNIIVFKAGILKHISGVFQNSDRNC